MDELSTQSSILVNLTRRPSRPLFKGDVCGIRELTLYTYLRKTNNDNNKQKYLSKSKYVVKYKTSHHATYTMPHTLLHAVYHAPYAIGLAPYSIHNMPRTLCRTRYSISHHVLHIIHHIPYAMCQTMRHRTPRLGVHPIHVLSHTIRLLTSYAMHPLFVGAPLSR